jgi:hypothetical protein
MAVNSVSGLYTTDANGKVAFGDIYGDCVVVVTNVTGYHTVTNGSFTLSATKPSDNVVVSDKIYSAEVVFKVGATPLVNTVVTMTINSVSGSYTTDANGKVVFNDIYGDYVVVVTNVAGYNSFAKGTLALDAANPSGEVAVNDKFYNAVITVKDGDGQAMEYVTVTLTYGGKSVDAIKQEDGTFLAQGVYGTATVTVVKEGYKFDGGSVTESVNTLTVTGTQTATENKCSSMVADSGFIYVWLMLIVGAIVFAAGKKKHIV